MALSDASGSRIQQRTKATYDLQWNRFPIIRPEEDRATFQSRTGLRGADLVGKTVLDAGCGMGRYLKVAVELGAERVVGLELSRAVRAARQVNSDSPQVEIVQGDLLRPPFREAQFDHIYSLGVLDHTPDAYRAFRALVPLLKPGGRIAIWIYRKQRPALEAMTDLQRAVSTRLPLSWLVGFSKLMAPLGGWKRRLMSSESRPIERFGVALNVLTLGVSMHPDPEVRVCDTLDWYAPKYMSRHTDEEVEGWFRAAGLTQIVDLSRDQSQYHAGQGNGVNFAGIRPHS